jgi:NTE family protein
VVVKSALVLGGGGLVGIAWESGIAAGLAETMDPCSFDLFVGTSAGAVIGAQLACGRVPSWTPEASNAAELGSVDMALLGQIFTLWGQMTVTSPAEAAAIGKLARNVAREREAEWIARIGASAGVGDWPSKPLLISAVDTETGERTGLDRSCGAPLAHAIAASAAVPGMFPSVGIGGRLYMDGQVHSSTHADLLAPYRPEQVTIIVPTNAATGGLIGGHADRMLQAEVALLRELGCAVSVKTPSVQEARRIGGFGLMDSSATPEAYAVGLETGRAWGKQLQADHVGG